MKIIRFLCIVLPLLGTDIAYAQGISTHSDLKESLEACVNDAIAENDVGKNWVRRYVNEGGDGERHNVIYFACRDQQVARDFWILLGRNGAPEFDSKEHDGDTGRVRYFGDFSSCVHTTASANGDPKDRFFCLVMVDATPATVDAF